MFELIIKTPLNQSLQVIEFNFDELKAGIEKSVERYKGLIYNDEQIAIAKKDKAALNNFIKALDEKRKQIKADYLMPYNDFENKIKILQKLVQEPLQDIDKQIKNYDEQEKAKKQAEIDELYKKLIGELADKVPYRMLEDNRYLNKTYKLKDVEEDLKAKIDKVNEDISMLNLQENYKTEMLDEYFKTLSLSDAIRFGERLKLIDEEKRKAKERAEQARQEALKQAQEVSEPTQTIESLSGGTMFVGRGFSQKPEEQNQNVKDVDYTEVGEDKDQELAEISFKVTATAQQFRSLKEFFVSNNIKFEKI